MTDWEARWNVFEHSEQSGPPGKIWVRTPMLDSIDVHVWPRNDVMEHALYDYCLCGPTIEQEMQDGMLIARAIIHKARDGRPGPLEE